MPRYVILEHDYPQLHWDLMLESGMVLITWRLCRPPSPGVAIRATEIEHHRLFYLDYEGPISADRGKVTRWDAGVFEWLLRDSFDLTIRLDGERCRGIARLDSIREEWTFALQGECDFKQG